MIKLKPIALAIIGCGLLQACSAPSPSNRLAVQPVVRGDMPGNHAAGWNRLARFHHERGQLALALGAYAQSLALDASQLEARNAVAVIEAQQGNLEAARKALVALVNDYPGEAQPHTNLGYVQHLQGDQAGAVQTLRRAMALGAGPTAFQNLQMAEAASRAQAGASEATIAAAAPVAPAAAAAPAMAVTPVVETAPATPRQDAPLLTVLPNDVRASASRMELIQLAGNVFELKQRIEVPPAPALALATPKPAVQTIPRAGKVRMVRLEVANGNGVTGMARRFRNLLGQMGIPVDRLSNEKPYRQATTTIQFRPGFEKQAASLQKALQGKAQLSSRELSTSDVRLVLGKDARLSLAAASEAAGLSLAAIQDDGAGNDSN